MSRSPATQVAIDGAAVCLSAACLVHCLVVPLVLSLAPWIVPEVMADERFHLWAVVLALPLSLVGIGLGAQIHRRVGIVALAALGLAALTFGALWAPEGWSEVLASATGATFLAVAHLRNWRLRRSSPTEATAS